MYQESTIFDTRYPDWKEGLQAMIGFHVGEETARPPVPALEYLLDTD